MQSVMAFYVLLYIVLGLVIYHSMFDIWYFNLGKALLRELVGAILFAVIMAGFTSEFDESVLNQWEKANAKTISDYEKKMGNNKLM